MVEAAAELVAETDFEVDSLCVEVAAVTAAAGVVGKAVADHSSDIQSLAAAKTGLESPWAGLAMIAPESRSAETEVFVRRSPWVVARKEMVAAELAGMN